MPLKRNYPDVPILAACTAIWRGDHVLLVQRSASPNAGKWAMPGGVVETGETLEQAAVREVLEETALQIENPLFNRFHEIIRQDDHGRTSMHYVLAMYAVCCSNENAVAGDDAAAVQWFAVDELEHLNLTPHTLTFLRESRTLLGI